MDIFIKFEENIVTFKEENMLKEGKYHYGDNKIESIIVLRAKELEISDINSVTVSLKEKQFNEKVEYDASSDLIKIKFNEFYEIQNFKNIIFKPKSEVENNVDQVLDNQDENKDKDKDKDKEINQENKESKENQEKNENKENKENKESKENKENKDDIKEVPQVKENSIKLVLVKVFIGVIFFLLSVIIILFVRIKSLQKRKANYIELTGIDSV